MVIAYAILVLLGVITWTFLEYLIHRFLGHMKQGKNVIRSEHKRHHAEAHYFAPLYKKLILALLVLGFFTLTIGLLLDFKSGFSFSMGVAGMYFIYEVTHRRYHVKEPLIRYGLRMRKHHFFHHFGNPNVNHGVTTAFWDRVFGTFKPTTLIRVPGKMAMKWLTDDYRQIKPRYQRHFRLC